MTTEQMVDAILSKKHGDARSAIAWFIGYVESHQRDLNMIRATLGSELRETLVEQLERENNAGGE